MLKPPETWSNTETDDKRQLMMIAVEMPTITKKCNTLLVSGWYRAIIISSHLGKYWSRLDEYSYRRLINDEGWQCWVAQNSLNYSDVHASSFLHPLHSIFSRLLHDAPPSSSWAHSLLAASLSLFNSWLSQRIVQLSY